jgi:hypothetical protein
MMQVEDQRADSKATAATLRDAFCDIVHRRSFHWT